MRVYLAGPMSGIADHNFPEFDRVAFKLRAAAYTVISPAELTRKEWADYGGEESFVNAYRTAYRTEAEQRAHFVRTDTLAVARVAGVVLMRGWQMSRGAVFEAVLASQFGLRIDEFIENLGMTHGFSLRPVLTARSELIALLATLEARAEQRDPATLKLPTEDFNALKQSSANAYGNPFIGEREAAYLNSTPKVTQTIKHESVLSEADRLVSGERQSAYGHPLDNFTHIAQLWSAYLRIKGVIAPDEIDLRAEDVALMMDLLKVARESHSPKRDNRVDGPGYWKCLDLILEERERRGKH